MASSPRGWPRPTLHMMTTMVRRPAAVPSQSRPRVLLPALCGVTCLCTQPLGCLSPCTVTAITAADRVPVLAGVYICVKAYGSANTSYAVRAISTICPSDFAPDGTEILCSSRVDAPESEQHFSECTPDGQCLCRAQWAKPLPEVYHGEQAGHKRNWSCSAAICSRRLLLVDSLLGTGEGGIAHRSSKGRSL